MKTDISDIAAITPVILCGGAGTRLWPLSDRECPKQFVKRRGTPSMFQQTVLRVQSAGLGVPVIMTSRDWLDLVTGQLAELGAVAAQIIVEPERRNTGAAVCAAALVLGTPGPEQPLLVLPSDHFLDDGPAWSDSLTCALPSAQNGNIVAFGVTPDRAETGYGHIEAAPKRGGSARPILQFIEKPDAAGAWAMVACGRYLWNAGIFLARGSVLNAAFDRFAPQIAEPVRRSVQDGRKDGPHLFLAADYAKAESLSFDHAVMELAGGEVVPFTAGWKDLGSWRSMWEAARQDRRGAAVEGNSHAYSCADTLLFNERPDTRLVGVGLRNVVAVASGDTILITDLDAAQHVGDLPAEIRTKYIQNTYEIHTSHRPWGSYEILTCGPGYQVKRLNVDPGGCLSLQSHAHRAEHWVVVSGKARVTLAGREKIIAQNQYVHIEKGAVHRLANPGATPLHLIEVQTGSYLGEDDITRYDDIYARV